MFERSSLAVASLIGLLVMGCSSEETTSSANIKTGGIAALMDVYADTATTATVHVELKVGGSDSNTFVALQNGDELIATAGDQEKTLSATDKIGRYEALFTGVEAETVFSVVLERPSDTTAAGNSGTLPVPFDLADPTDDLSRADDDLEVTWEPSGTGDDMDLEFDGDCIFKHTTSASDSGSSTIEKGSLESTGGDMPKKCEIELKAQRSRSGTADTAFDPESWFRLHQRRSTTFHSNP
jgi:hypothetical protein